MCPCGILLGAIPILAQRRLAQKRRVMRVGRFLHDGDERAPGRGQMHWLDQQHLTIGLNDCLDSSHLETKSNMVGGIRNGE